MRTVEDIPAEVRRRADSRTADVMRRVLEACRHPTRATPTRDPCQHSLRWRKFEKKCPNVVRFGVPGSWLHSYARKLLKDTRTTEPCRACGLCTNLYLNDPVYLERHRTRLAEVVTKLSTPGVLSTEYRVWCEFISNLRHFSALQYSSLRWRKQTTQALYNRSRYTDLLQTLTTTTPCLECSGCYRHGLAEPCYLIQLTEYLANERANPRYGAVTLPVR